MRKKLLTNGNVFKRTDGRWGGVVWYMDEQGERKRKSFSGTTKQETNKKITAYIAEFEKAIEDIDESKKLLKDSLQNWLETVKFPSVEQTSYGRREDLLKIITSNRIDKMLKQGLIESKTNIKNETVYTYTDKGKSFIKNLDSLKEKPFYSRQTASRDHDTRLFREYTQLTPTERMSCMSESQTRDLYTETIKQDQANAELEKMLSVPDITYTTETGETVAIEVITENYNEQRIEMKVNYCQTVKIELRTVRI